MHAKKPRINYRDIFISQEVAKTYLELVKKLSNKFREEFNAAAKQQITEHLKEKAPNISTDTTVKLEATPEVSSASYHIMALNGFSSLIENIIDGVPINLIIAAFDDEELLTMIQGISKEGTDKFYEACNSRGLESPQDVLSSTDIGKNFFSHQEWENMRGLTRKLFNASSLLTQLEQEIDAKVVKLPPRVPVEKGFDFS